MSSFINNPLYIFISSSKNFNTVANSPTRGGSQKSLHTLVNMNHKWQQLVKYPQTNIAGGMLLNECLKLEHISCNLRYELNLLSSLNWFVCCKNWNNNPRKQIIIKKDTLRVYMVKQNHFLELIWRVLNVLYYFNKSWVITNWSILGSWQLCNIWYFQQQP